MKLSKIVFSFLIIASAFAAGCSSTEAQVESLCEDAKQCENAGEYTKSLNCADFAAKTTEAAEKTGCSGEYSDLIDCQSSLDVCAPYPSVDPCAAEIKAIASCSETYCKSNPKDDLCGSTDETSG